MSKKTKSKGSGLAGRIIRRFFLLLFTIIVLLVVGLALVMNLVFNGPSTAARDALTMSLLEPSATKWIPGLFMDDALVEQIRNKGKDEAPLEEVNLDDIVIMDSNSMAASDEWAAYPDGIRIESYAGKTFNAHIMLIQDPSRVYLGLSSYDGFSTSKPGKRGRGRFRRRQRRCLQRRRHRRQPGGQRARRPDHPRRCGGFQPV